MNSEFAYETFGRLRIGYEQKAIIECNVKCRCGPECPNRTVQSGRKMRLTIFKTEQKGWGIKTTEPIPVGTFIEEYMGEILTSEEADERAKKDTANGTTYLFDLDGFLEPGMSTLSRSAID